MAHWIGKGPYKDSLIYYNDLKGSGIVYYKTKNQWEDIRLKHAVVAIFYKQVRVNN